MACCGVIIHLIEIEVYTNCSRSGSTLFQRKLVLVAVEFFLIMPELKRSFFVFQEAEETKVSGDQPVLRRTSTDVGFERPWVAF